MDGTIMVQRVEDPVTGDDPIQITLVDQDGEFVKGFFVFQGLDGGFVPTCAAYNSLTSEYCIAGINDGNTTLPNGPTGSWFLFLDGDLNIINIHMCGVDLSSSGVGPNWNLQVSDITPVEGASSFGLGDFVYVGVAGGNNDPSPNNNTTSTEKMMYIGYASSGGMGFTRAFDYGSQYNNAFFPSRVIEVPMSSQDGGFMITGIGTVNGDGWGSLFFTRTDYQFGNSGATDMYTPANTTEGLSAGDLYFDKLTDEIWFAGVGRGSSDLGPSLIFNKIVNLTSSGVDLFDNTCFSATGLTDNAFGKASLFYSGIPKIAKIMPTLDPTIGAIASNYYENNYYANDTKTFPMLNKINFADANLFDFTTLFFQDPSLYSYTRNYGNIGLGNYLPYLEYPHPWYPSHNAHDFPFSDETYVLGGTTLDPVYSPSGPEYMVLNRTGVSGNYYESPCNYDNRSSAMGIIQYDVNSLTPIWGADVLYSYFPSQNIDNINGIYRNDCNGNGAGGGVFFKAGNLSILSKIQPINAQMNQSNLIIKTSNEAKIYKVYNALGALILRGRMNEGYAMAEIIQFADGMYLIEVLDSQNKRIGVKKVIK